MHNGGNYLQGFGEEDWKEEVENGKRRLIIVKELVFLYICVHYTQE